MFLSSCYLLLSSYHLFFLLSPVSFFLTPLSFLLSPASFFLSPISFLLSPVSFFLSSVSFLSSPVLSSYHLFLFLSPVYFLLSSISFLLLLFYFCSSYLLFSFVNILLPLFSQHVCHFLPIYSFSFLVFSFFFLRFPKLLDCLLPCRRCEANGKWSKATVECRIIKCPTPRAPSGGRVSGYNYEVHRKVVRKLLFSFAEFINLTTVL